MKQANHDLKHDTVYKIQHRTFICTEIIVSIELSIQREFIWDTLSR